MREVVATGKTLELIREQWSNEWNCSPEQLEIEILEKPGVFNRVFKAKVSLPQEVTAAELHEDTRINWDGTKYVIDPGAQIEVVVPYPTAGKLTSKGKEIVSEYAVSRGEVFEFHPLSKQGGLSWTITVAPDNTKAVARVRHEHGGKYVFSTEIPVCSRLQIERYLTWDSSEDTGEEWNEDALKYELTDKGIIYGMKPNIWIEFLTVVGISDIIIAEYTPAVPTIQPQLIDYVGEPVSEDENEVQEEKIDFFGSKLRTCEKDELLARKIPGKDGTPGVDIFGNILPVEKLKDFSFKLKKNVYLTDDGLEVHSSCSGTPIRINNYTYSVENAFILQRDIDLHTGSIDFPGDVMIGRDVKDGFYVYAEGKVTIHGSVSGAEIKAEAGLDVKNNIIASRVSVGERHVFRSQLTQMLQQINEDLELCLVQVEQLQNASGNSNFGQLLKLILEKKFPELPKVTEELDNLLTFKDPEYVSQELEVAVKTLKHFLVGMGPLQLKNMVYLKNALKIIGHFLQTKGSLVPGNLLCETNYIQNSEIKCAGDFICRKGIYNSTVHVENNIQIYGVCRGGEINCTGDIYIWELGGSCLSQTILKVTKASRIKVDFSYANIRIYVGKEIVRIDENVQKLEIYREKGILQVEKLKWDGHN